MYDSKQTYKEAYLAQAKHLNTLYSQLQIINVQGDSKRITLFHDQIFCK